MKIKVLPTGNAPAFYNFDGDIITAVHDNQSESFDLSALTAADQFQGVEADTLNLPGSQIIRDAYRDDSGELHVTLCQRVGPGHWEAGAEIDAAQYDPDAIMVNYRQDKPHAGKPFAVTAEGKQWVA